MLGLTVKMVWLVTNQEFAEVQIIKSVVCVVKD